MSEEQTISDVFFAAFGCRILCGPDLDEVDDNGPEPTNIIPFQCPESPLGMPNQTNATAKHDKGLNHGRR